MSKIQLLSSFQIFCFEKSNKILPMFLISYDKASIFQKITIYTSRTEFIFQYFTLCYNRNINYMNNGTISISKSQFVESRRDNIRNHYCFDKEIGKGSYGVVYKAKQKGTSNSYRAIKKMSKKLISNNNSFRNEIQNLTFLDHPSILKIYEIFQDETSLYLVTDLCEGGELFDKIDNFGPFSQNDAKKIFWQLMEALNYCHKNKICHRDVKPQNIMFTDKEGLNMKLIDFGLSFRYENKMRQQLTDWNIVGTSYYISPEIIAGSYDERCDIWAAGVMLYILVSSVPPFDGDTDKQILKCVKRGQYSFEFPEMQRVSDECKDLIKRLLVPQNQRLTIQQIFAHPWMENQASRKPLNLNLQRLSQFSKYSKLKKITASFIASKLSEKEVQELSDIFRAIDSNHDGQISFQELKTAVQNKRESPSYQQLKQMVDGIDINRNGKINYTQFIASYMERAKMFSKEHLLRFFKVIDKDSNGKIDKEEIKSILQRSNFSRIDNKEVQQVMSEFDNNNDGIIDFNEFINVMTK